MRLTSIAIDRQTFEVDVTATGFFEAEFDGAEVRAESLGGLRAKLAEAIVKARKQGQHPVALPVLELHRGRIQRGTITGRHAANGNLLVAWEGGKHDQIAQYEHGRLLNPEALGEEGLRDLQRLSAQIEEGERAHRALIEKASFRSLDQLVDDALAGKG